MGADVKTMQASLLSGDRGSAGGRKPLERLRVSEWKESSGGQVPGLPAPGRAAPAVARNVLEASGDFWWEGWAGGGELPGGSLRV